LKKYWNDERIKGAIRITKNNFIEMLFRAWTLALTEDNIKAAFRVTAVHPFDPSVIKDSDLAPSRATTSSVALPVEPSTPVRLMTSHFRKITSLSAVPRIIAPHPSRAMTPPLTSDVDMDDDEDKDIDPLLRAASHKMRAQLAIASAGDESEEMAPVLCAASHELRVTTFWVT
jgi:hypothetical protein